MKKEKNTETKKEAVVEVAPKKEEAPAPKVETKVTKVGGLLKEMRLQKGLRLPEVAKTLCIRKDFLEAIEDSNYAEIPAFPYGVGFVRSYATYLGLNSSNIVELYKDETTPKAQKDMFVLEPQSEASVPSKKYLLISLLALLVVYAAWSAYNSSIEEDVAAPAEEAVVSEDTAAAEDMPIVVEDFSAEPVMEAEAEVVAASESESKVENKAEQITVTEEKFVEPVKESMAPVEEKKTAPKVVINVKEETWIEVKDAEKLYISKVLKAGATYNVPEGKGMILSVGKVNGVDVVINGVVTKVAKPNKKTNIALDPFLDENH